MMGTLDILVVDDRPDTVRFLTEFLVQRCRRVDVASSVREAMTAVTRRRAAGERYHLVISDFVMPEADGLSLLRELRDRQDDVPFIFVTGYRSLNPTFEPEARRLGALAILDKPIDLRRVEEIINQTTEIIRRRREEKQGDQPFFGTSKTYRRATDSAPASPAASPAAASDALERRQPVRSPGAGTYVPPSLTPASGASALEPAPPMARPVAPPPPEYPQALPPPPPQAPPVVRPQTASIQRRPSGIIGMGSGTARIRRSVEPPPPPAAPGGGTTSRIARSVTPQPPTAFTARIRRGVEGSAMVQRQGVPESGRMVSCTMCGRSFLVAARPEAYTTVCLHCGQLQRIDPA